MSDNKTREAVQKVVTHDIKKKVNEEESNIIFMTRYNTMPLYRQLLLTNGELLL